MKNKLCVLFYFIILSFGCKTNASIDKSDLTLVWSEEFNYDGIPNQDKWSYDIGNGCNLPCGCGWGNGELQYYTHAEKENAYVSHGNLTIRALKSNKKNNPYTSARLVTKGKGQWKYGRVEIRAQLPKGNGIWPAIWMLPSSKEFGGWPKSGEIDIMEHVGYIPDTIYGTIHTEAYNGMKGTQIGGNIFVDNPSFEFHTYSIEWNKDEITWYVDHQPYFNYRNEQIGIESWPFNQPFHLILNIAVGGHWGGVKGVDPSIFPQEMKVDYIRIYQ